METHPEVELLTRSLLAVVLLDGALDLDGTAGSLNRTAEHRHQPVAQGLHLVAPGCRQGPADKGEVDSPKLLGGVVAETLKQFRGPHQIGEEEGHHPRRTGHRPES